MITFENISFSYDGERQALRDITLTIPPGEFLCILGGNGSGKSTLAKHINALLEPDAGVVTVCGYDTRNEENRFLIRSQTGMVFQNPDDQIVASLVENDVAFGPENLGILNPELRNRVNQSLESVGLKGYETHETHSLSGGQKQRVALAGALALNPKILVLDEASAMLDPRGQQELMKACKSLHARSMTIVMITHFMEEAVQADRVIILENGSIACDGTPHEVLRNKDQLKGLNLEVPFALRLSLRLQEQGVPIQAHTDETTLKEELCQLLLNQ